MKDSDWKNQNDKLNALTRPARKAQECDCYVQCSLHINAPRLLDALEEAHKLLLENDIIMTGNEALLRECRGSNVNDNTVDK